MDIDNTIGDIRHLLRKILAKFVFFGIVSDTGLQTFKPYVGVKFHIRYQSNRFIGRDMKFKCGRDENLK